MQAACFSGCVQMLANIFMLKEASIASIRDSDMSASAIVRGHIAERKALVSYGAVAEALLASVQTEMKALAEAGFDNEKSALGEQQVAHCGASQVSTVPAAPRAPMCRTDSCQAEIDVVVGEAQASTSHYSPGATATAAGKYKLLFCEPACLVVGQQQQLKLHVCPAEQQVLSAPTTITGNCVSPNHQGGTEGVAGNGAASEYEFCCEAGSCAGDAAAVRLLVWTDGGVLLDQEVLVCNGRIR
jgi:hypothetical protein